MEGDTGPFVAAFVYTEVRRQLRCRTGEQRSRAVLTGPGMMLGPNK